MKYLLLIIFPILSLTQGTFNPPYYNQCNQTWANDTLGHGPNTICQAGCLMSSVTAMMAGEGVLINETEPNPGLTNKWLIENGGYVDGDLFLWASIQPLGGNFIGFLYTPVSIAEAFEQGYRIVLNVLEGDHFVLLLNVLEDCYQVMDPAFNRDTYLFQDVLRAGYYSWNTTQIIKS
jgi:hypothetical protein